MTGKLKITLYDKIDKMTTLYSYPFKYEATDTLDDIMGYASGKAQELLNNFNNYLPPMYRRYVIKSIEVEVLRDER